MNKQDWDCCTDAVPMLDFLRAQVALSDRKERLWACACCRRLLHLFPEERHRRHVEVAERYADGTASEEDLRADQTTWPWGFSLNPGPGYDSDNLAWIAPDRIGEVAGQADLLRCIFGPLLFRPIRLDPRWRTPLVLSLVQAAYQERVALDPARPGWLTLDPDRLLILADALEEADCTDSEVLGHLRGRGPHARGCWCLDLLLAMEPDPTQGAAAGGPEAAVPTLVRFRPSRVEGLPDVREVVVHPDRLEVNTAGAWVTFRFNRIGRRQEGRLVSLLKRLVKRVPWAMLVADRDWFHPPRDRFFLWYTDPPLRTCMPEDEPTGYEVSYFLRIQRVLGSGGYATADLG